MDIFAILSMDERVIVFSSEGDRTLITWNLSCTLQEWRPAVRMNQFDYPNGKFDPNDWEEVECRTLSVEPINYREARDAAIRWYNGV